MVPGFAKLMLPGGGIKGHGCSVSVARFTDATHLAFYTQTKAEALILHPDVGLVSDGVSNGSH